VGRPIGDVAARLSYLGFDCPASVRVGDLRLISRLFAERGPWLGEKEVPPAHLLGAAIALDMTMEEAAGKLERLGFRVHPSREFSSPGAYLRALEDHAARAAGQGGR